MTCEEFTNLISARIDGEISADDQRLLEAHLGQCEGCRATAAALADQDARLQRAFAGHGQRAAAVAEAVTRRLKRDQRTFRLPWLSAVLSAAAGFALALLIFRPWERPRSPIAMPTTVQSSRIDKGVAQLALATGAIEVQQAGANDWRPMATGAAIEPDSRIRTAEKVRCELELPDGSLVRLNSGSELRVSELRQFELMRGQMFSNVARAQKPFVVAVGEAKVTALGTQFDVEVKPEATTVRVLEGMTQVTAAGGAETLLFPSEMLTIENGRPGQVVRSYNLMIATNWVNELLALKGRDNAELRKRVNDLLAELGQVKVSELFEEEIRSLGEHCLVPLTRYLQSSRSAGTDAIEVERRRRAARIVSDLARPWLIPDLIELLKNPDPQVSASMGNALQRLTGESGKSPAQWKQWWETNKERFGG